ncbi:adenylate/guanylate cyclase domain-containing protein [Flavobacterium reichenbachii]|uniref:Guanylate cyclase domain-containing protein n=1 Tax=Flavobacterium reichenbachii TaxID=362418 RepID=A0A085ZQ82_9FLAO|nr:adenylate/guanylate cyclase domain-containing protein [Flavobacterium reichenbachii]KFF06596.1 hypothetical protein IW19_14245 [Flavobacterium reichenbachii]OXB18798.1 adenylate/guanylate cyclase domain-containing protein [Flavobacterium reichenbachii]
MTLPKIPFFRKYNIFFKAVIIGGVLGLFYGIITDAVATYKHFGFLPGIMIGVSIGFIVIVFENVLFKLNSYPFLAVMALKAFIYSISILILLILFVFGFTELLGQNLDREGLGNYVRARLAGDFFFSLCASIFLILFLEVSSLLSSRFFYNYFTGRYHSPVQEERIFMFVDVKSSTTIAEELGDILYSQLLQDLFNDFSDGILASRAEIYQYAGDEIILTWKTSIGLKDQRCLYCFYLLRKSIESRKNYYLKKYNLIPKFKAGMHIGTAVTTWVGKIKKEIVYHGDLLNTASRIQCKCNDLNHDFVVSEAIKNVMPENFAVTYNHKGEIHLRGKAQPLKLYTVDFNF